LEVFNVNKHSNYGFSSILLTFVMICILTFSALALISANSDWQLSQKAAANNTAYFSAEKEATLALARIDNALAVSFADSADEISYYDQVKETVPKLCGGDFEETSAGYELSYEVPVQDGLTLHVRLSICYPDRTAQNFYQILEWKTVHESSYVEDEPLHLMGEDE
jgi:hypothetical protein